MKFKKIFFHDFLPKSGNFSQNPAGVKELMKVWPNTKKAYLGEFFCLDHKPKRD
jgi:hypothetical protein